MSDVRKNGRARKKKKCIGHWSGGGDGRQIKYWMIPIALIAIFSRLIIIIIDTE